jgi:hypothetical protein
MRSLIGLVLTVAFLMSSAVRGQSSGQRAELSAQSGADAISAALDRGEVGRVEILRLPEDLETGCNHARGTRAHLLH